MYVCMFRYVYKIVYINFFFFTQKEKLSANMIMQIIRHYFIVHKTT